MEKIHEMQQLTGINAGLNMTPQERKQITSFESYAIWKYNRFCFFCGRYIDYRDSTNDHVIPIELTSRPLAFQKLLRDLELPSDFDVNAPYNLLPCHHRCNSSKSNQIYGLTLHWLRQAMKNEARVRKCINEMQNEPWQVAIKIIAFDAMGNHEMTESQAAKLHRVIRLLEEWQIRVNGRARVILSMLCLRKRSFKPA